jgi:hypothetical protein
MMSPTRPSSLSLRSSLAGHASPLGQWLRHAKPKAKRGALAGTALGEQVADYNGQYLCSDTNEKTNYRISHAAFALRWRSASSWPLQNYWVAKISLEVRSSSIGCLSQAAIVNEAKCANSHSLSYGCELLCVLSQELAMKQIITVALFALTGMAAPAAAESPVALVEEVQGKVSGAEAMDYLSPHAVIKLGQNGSVVLSYLNSCRRETIKGIGTVIVGTEESSVHLADVKSEKTLCDAAHSHATARETSEVAATVMRGVNQAVSASPTPQLTLYGASPLVEAKGRGELVIERLDVIGERQKIDLDGSQLKGKFFDFARANRALTPGGLYVATFGRSRIVFRIDSVAISGATPMVGRLLRME